MTKKVSVGDWAEKGKGKDIENGIKITLLDGGREVLSSFKDKNGNDQYQNVFSIETRNGAKNISLNQTSINALVDEYGEDSDAWVGRELIVHAIKQNVQGKFVDVYYFVPEGYEMGEYGFEKEGSQGVSKGDDEQPPF